MRAGRTPRPGREARRAMEHLATFAHGGPDHVAALLDEGQRRPPARDLHLRKGFLLTDGANGIAVQLLRRTGGQDAIQLKLALLLYWIGSSHDGQQLPPVNAGLYAHALDLPDAAAHGARRVRTALAALEQHGLLERTDRRPRPTEIRLLAEDGSRRPYAPPGENEAIIGVPGTLFTRGWLAGLSGPALVSLLVLLVAAPREGEGAGGTRGRRARDPNAVRIAAGLGRSSWYESQLELEYYAILSRTMLHFRFGIDRFTTVTSSWISYRRLGRPMPQATWIAWTGYQQPSNG